jgi:hypothetical protein
MSKTNITTGEYIQRYADMYCNGNTEEAMKHEIVKEVMKGLKDDKTI